MDPIQPPWPAVTFWPCKHRLQDHQQEVDNSSRPDQCVVDGRHLILRYLVLLIIALAILVSGGSVEVALVTIGR